MANVPSSARVVIIGGGVIGCSVAYHLAKLGWKDVVLLERKQLTSGTTWHAAGLIAQLRATANMTKLAKYSQELYGNLEEETGVATGFKRVGSITVSLTDERKEEIYRQAGMARAFGVEVEEISPTEVKQRYEHLNIEGVTGGVYLPLDGQGDPANIALALAKGARQNGAKVIERTAVTKINKDGRRVTSIEWASGEETGEIACDMIVNCSGMWGHEVGRMAGVNVPLQACEHFYIVTEAIEGLQQMPVLRVPDECAYYVFLRISSSTNSPKISTTSSRSLRPLSNVCRCWPRPVSTRSLTAPKALPLMTPTTLASRQRWTTFGSLRALTQSVSNRLVALAWRCRNGWTRAKSRLIWATSTSTACSRFRETKPI